MFDDVVMKGRCPVCECETHQTKGWFRIVRELAASAAIFNGLEKLLTLTRRDAHEAACSGSAETGGRATSAGQSAASGQ